MLCLNFIAADSFAKKFHCLLMVLVAAFSSGCAPAIVAGVGAGAFSYYSGNLVRVYEADYNHAVRVSSKVLKQLNFTVKGKASDGLRTVLTAERADKTPVTIVVEQVEDNVLNIGVRNGPIGISNLKASEQVHNHIAQQLAEKHIVKKEPIEEQIKKISATHPKIILTNDAVETTPAKTSSIFDLTSPTVKKDTDVEPYTMKSSADYGSEPVDPNPDTKLPTSVDENKSTEPIQVKPLVLNENDPTNSTPSVTNTTANSEPKKESNRTSPFYRSTHYIFYKKQEQTIPNTAYEVLDKVVDYMKENVSASLEIRAYTDSTGDPIDNLEISKYRAHSIRDYLKEKGIGPEKMTAEGHGASNFLESNRTESLRAINRRVELRIL